MAFAKYKGYLLATNSTAHDILFREKDIKKLEKHLKEIRKKEKEVLENSSKSMKTFAISSTRTGESDVIHTPYMVLKHKFFTENIELFEKDGHLHVTTLHYKGEGTSLLISYEAPRKFDQYSRMTDIIELQIKSEDSDVENTVKKLVADMNKEMSDTPKDEWEISTHSYKWGQSNMMVFGGKAPVTPEPFENAIQ